jgi:hypothetical protein
MAVFHEGKVLLKAKPQVQSWPSVRDGRGSRAVWGIPEKDCKPRPKDGPWDIGAYQFVAPAEVSQ